jgi:hypothetical protein
MNAMEYIGISNYNNEDFAVYKKAGRYEFHPIMNPVKNTLINPVDDLELAGGGALGKLLNDDKDISRYFNNRDLTKETLLEKFGDKEVDRGVKVKDIVGNLPDGVVYESADKMVEAVAKETPKVVKTADERKRIVSAYGVGKDVDSINDAPVARLNGVTPETNKLLANKGIDTIGKLSEASTKEIKTALRTMGTKITDGEIAALRGNALTLVELDKK